MTFSMRIPVALMAAMSLFLTACPGDEDCEPQTCAELGFECGTHDDGCGGTIECGTCDSPPAARCDENTAVNYEATGSCSTDGTCDYTSNEEPCGTSDCTVVAGEAVCQEPAPTCDIDGFTAAEQTGFADIELLEMAAFTSAQPPGDALFVEWWFDYGAEFTGPGSYPVEQNTNYNDCGFCVTIIRFDDAGAVVQTFFATEGVVEVTAIGGDGDPFTGVLNDMVFAEWSAADDTMVPGGETWCIDGFTWDTALDGTLP